MDPADPQNPPLHTPIVDHRADDFLSKGIFIWRRSSHPFTALLILLFKLAPIIGYIFGGIFISSTIHIFCIVLIAACIDFWYIKNVAGRKLLGLRWWNGDDPLGGDGWVFESYDNKDLATAFDRVIFWQSLTASSIFWLVLLISKVISFSLFWGALVFICFALNATNYYGYSQSHREHVKKIQRITRLYGDIWETIQGLAQI
jgi:hypothetical protein